MNSEHQFGCPALGSSAGAECTCVGSGARGAGGTLDQPAPKALLQEFVQAVNSVLKYGVVVKYEYRPTPQGQFETPGEWQKATLKAESCADGILTLQLGDKKIPLPAEGWDYRHLTFQRTASPMQLARPNDDPLPGGEPEIIRRRKEQDINWEDLASFLHLLLEEEHRVLVRLGLQAHYGVRQEQDRKAKCLENFMAWSGTIDPNSSTWTKQVEYGGQLLEALRVAAISWSARIPEATISNKLKKEVTQDPLTRVAAELQERSRKAPTNGQRFSRQGLPSKPQGGKPRPCKYCGTMWNQTWDDHDCPKWCKKHKCYKDSNGKCPQCK